ncbi:MAG: MFS transporter [Alphaproteobacteria bacterium]|nr:MFS transporter [Alphaproteobacteria bacterium]
MADASSEDLLALFDRAPLNRRYWVSFGLMSLLTVLDFFDFFLIAFILAVIGPEWHLTYGQSAVILYGGGVGAILGSLVWGSLADVWGRKLQVVTGTLICAISAGLIGLLPVGAWALLALLRLMVGFGLGAAATPALTIVVELTPTRFRTGVTSFYVVFASAGTLVASFTSATLLSMLGWRGVAMLGIVPVIAGVLVWFFVPESVRWLMAKGRFAEAREEVARHLGLPLASVPLPTTRPLTQPRASLAELYRNPRLFWQTVIIWAGSSTAVYGYYLWGPTIVALVLGVPVGQAAKYFVYVAASAVIGKILVSFIAPATGRRSLGVAFAALSMICLAGAGYYHDAVVGGFPVLVVLIAASAFFCEGGFSNLAPYTVEQYGVRFGARSAGLGQAANGVGKILGPLALALIAGSSNIVSPQATADAVLPAFLFLAGNMLLVTLAYVFLGVETHGRPMGIGDEHVEVTFTGRADRRAGRAAS